MASASWLNEHQRIGFSFPAWEQGFKGDGKEKVVKEGQRLQVTDLQGQGDYSGRGCIFFLSLLKSLAECHRQICSPFSCQKLSIFWKKSLWAGPGAQSQAEAGQWVAQSCHNTNMSPSTP